MSPGKIAYTASGASDEVIIPKEVVEIAEQSIGAFFEPIAQRLGPDTTRIFLDLSTSYERMDILRRYTSIEGKRLLEIGSGFGTNLAVWIKNFNVDAYGVEPGGPGFNQGYIASRMLFEANNIDPERIINSAGEALPFPDNSFDVVYSANVLEHTQNPEQVLREAFRVLRPDGVLHIEVPNYLSYLEGHYMVFQPPIVWKPILVWWVKYVFGRDPSFAKTLHTQINPLWCKREVKKNGQIYPLELISVGDELFLEHFSRPVAFETWTNRSPLQKISLLAKKLNFGNWIGRLIVLLQGYHPIYLTVKKKA